MSQKLSVNGFRWEDGLSRFNERFIKTYNEISNKGYFLEVAVEYLRKLFGSRKDLPYVLIKIFTRTKKIRKSRKTCL